MGGPSGRRFEQRYAKSSTNGALWEALPARPAVPAILSVTATGGAAIELREALVELGSWGPAALAPGLGLTHADLAVTSEFWQRDTRRRHILICADLTIAAGRAAFIRGQAGAGIGRQADPFRLSISCLAVVAGPALVAAVGATVTDRGFAPANTDVASWAGRVL